MLRDSRKIKRRLESEGWILDRIAGSHHIFRHLQSGAIVVLPHPKKELGTGLALRVYKDAGWAKD